MFLEISIWIFRLFFQYFLKIKYHTYAPSTYMQTKFRCTENIMNVAFKNVEFGIFEKIRNWKAEIFFMFFEIFLENFTRDNIGP